MPNFPSYNSTSWTKIRGLVWCMWVLTARRDGIQPRALTVEQKDSIMSLEIWCHKSTRKDIVRWILIRLFWFLALFIRPWPSTSPLNGTTPASQTRQFKVLSATSASGKILMDQIFILLGVFRFITHRNGLEIYREQQKDKPNLENMELGFIYEN